MRSDASSVYPGLLILVVALILIASLWFVIQPKEENVGGIIGQDPATSLWVMMSADESRIIHYYLISNPEAFTDLLECKRCLYSGEFRLRIRSTERGEMHGQMIYGHDADVLQVVLITRHPLQPECTHTK